MQERGASSRNNKTLSRISKFTAFTKKFNPLPEVEGKRRVAFTLAEVLITLGIIGVVAALTIPNIIQSYKNQVTVAKLQKAYSVLNQAYQNSVADNGPSEYWQESDEIGVKEYFNRYWQPYFKGINTCKSKHNYCGYAEQPFFYLNGSEAGLGVTDSRAFFKTNDDIFFMFTDNTRDSESNLVPWQYIYVDINGSKAPNTFGKDLFVFERVAGKGILPFGYNLSTNTINSNCRLSSGGTYCARKIMSEGWKINYLR